jgi:pSer/pThr/pTyr-binding forkhead associated (FHA) protein
MLGTTVEPLTISALKYGLLALLFLFIWRAMRWVVRGLNVDRTPPAAAGSDRGAPSPARPSMLTVQSDGQRSRSVRLDGSTNGTFVNDQKLVAPAMLTPGDKVRVGQTTVELRR